MKLIKSCLSYYRWCCSSLLCSSPVSNVPLHKVFLASNHKFWPPPPIALADCPFSGTPIRQTVTPDTYVRSPSDSDIWSQNRKRAKCAQNMANNNKEKSNNWKSNKFLFLPFSIVSIYPYMHVHASVCVCMNTIQVECVGHHHPHWCVQILRSTFLIYLHYICVN